ncbi:MAG: ABC transporter permease [Candidatus Altiarchaeota archaeon]|nr:ABC transporter permease [Candidatus Altiarchaeota archaeon]
MKEHRAIIALWYREVKAYSNDRPRIISSIVRSLLWLVIFGSGLNSARFSGLEVNYQEFLFPGVVGMSLLFTSMFAGVSVIWDREFGFLKEIVVSPITRPAMLLGKVLGGSTIAVAEALLILSCSSLIGVHVNWINLPLILLAMILISFTLVSLGLTVASFIESFEGFNTIMSFVIMPMFFMSGAVFPLSSVPEWMMPIVRLNPLTYGVDAIRTLILGISYMDLHVDFAVLAASSLLMLLLGSRAFKARM